MNLAKIPHASSVNCILFDLKEPRFFISNFAELCHAAVISDSTRNSHSHAQRSNAQQPGGVQQQVGRFVDESADEDDGVVWPTLTLSPHFAHEEPPAAPAATYGPYFEPEFATNVSVLAGQTVLLQCRVMDLGDRVVSISSWRKFCSSHIYSVVPCPPAR